jgi:hypothetical protein
MIPRRREYYQGPAPILARVVLMRAPMATINSPGVATGVPPALSQTPDFSLVLGGPLYQLWRGTHLAGDTLQLMHRRIIALALVAWAPLLVLSAAEGHAWGGGVTAPFLRDVDVHLRLLLAIPLLVVAEIVVHRRMRPVVGLFLDRGLIPDDARGRFDAAIASALRLRNSVAAELLLIAVVYAVGVGVVWRTQVALDVTSWYGVGEAGRLQPSMAGWWFGLVSLPLFQFLLLRWYFRLFIWARFQWQVSRIDLRLVPTNPDGSGGLGFLGAVSYAFAPVLAAQGVVLAGTIASKIFFGGAALLEFKVEIIGLVALMVFVILGPTLVFSPRLEAAKRAGLREYGTLAQRYVREFDTKWLRGGAPADEPLVGSADIQSLADLNNSYDVVKSMRWVPFTMQTVLQLAVTTLLPVLPLTLTMISFEELLDRVLAVLF